MNILTDESNLLIKDETMHSPEINQIPRIALSEMDAETFSRKHFRPGHPAHLKDTVGGWKTDRWTQPYLKSVLGDKLVKVAHNEDSTFDYNGSGKRGVVRIKSMPFGMASDLIHSDMGGNYYLQQQEIRKNFPELLEDFARPALLDDWTVIEVTNLWIGGKGCKSPLHFDNFDNFLVQISGLKRVTLFPPQQLENLYPAIGDALPHCSRVNVFASDLDESKFPLYKIAMQHMIRFYLEPGDTLYIPKEWWHAVETIEASISINFWWRSLI